MIDPLVAAMLAFDAAALAFGVGAVASAVRAVLASSPSTPGSGSVPVAVARALDRRAGRATAGFLLGSLCLLGAVAWTLPAAVPGAMCGAGVVQAAGRLGTRALVLRGLSLVLLSVAGTLRRLDRRAGGVELVPAVARAFLLAAPVAALSSFDSARAFAFLDGAGAVDCCSTVYALAGTGGGTPSWDAAWAGPLALGLGAFVVLSALGSARVAFRRAALARGFAIPCGLAALAFVPAVLRALGTGWASWHLGLLASSCPWCLLRGGSAPVGLLVAGSLVVVAREASALLASSLVAASADAGPLARARGRSAARRLAFAAALCLVAALAPVVASIAGRLCGCAP